MSGGYTHALVDELDRMILQENQVNIFYEAAFERLIAQGHTFGIVDTTSFFSMELDTVADFQQAIDKIPARGGGYLLCVLFYFVNKNMPSIF